MRLPARIPTPISPWMAAMDNTRLPAISSSLEVAPVASSTLSTLGNTMVDDAPDSAEGGSDDQQPADEGDDTRAILH
jgi:hypothetical protein